MSVNVMPGIITAVEEGRIEDAELLAADLLEDVDAASAVVNMARLAVVFHQHPNVSTRMLAAIWLRDGATELAETTLGQHAADLLEVAQARLGNGGADTAEAAAALARFDYLPGSTAFASVLCDAVAKVVSALALQQSYKDVVDREATVFGRELDEMTRAAFRWAQAVMRAGTTDGIAAPFGAIWSDPS